MEHKNQFAPPSYTNPLKLTQMQEYGDSVSATLSRRSLLKKTF